MKSWFDDLFESSARAVASRTARRSFIARLGLAMAGAAAVPLLPLVRGGRAEAAEPIGKSAAANWDDPKTCDYWAYCATDGWLCTGCGEAPASAPREPIPRRLHGSVRARTQATVNRTSSPITIAAASRSVSQPCARATKEKRRATYRSAPTRSPGALAWPPPTIAPSRGSCRW